MENRARIFGLYVLLGAICLRLSLPGTVPTLTGMLLNPEVAPIIIYVETGRRVRLFQETEPTEPTKAVPVSETTAPTNPTVEYTAEGLKLQYACKVSPDTEKLIAKPLQLSGKAVLLYSTHATESYTKQNESYRESGSYRTEAPDFNMISLGTALAEQLEQRGITVLQDETLHDLEDYNTAYGHSRKALRKWLAEHPEIGLVLDLHRDAIEGTSGQVRTRAPSEEEPCAKLMLVVGTDRSGLVHPNWEDNLSVALKLQFRLEALSPGITRPTDIRPQRFNQDVSPGALLIEIGSAGNTHAEALRAVAPLAEAIAELLEERSE